ncbi:MAG: TIGR01777 family oxidoreductase [Myxococcota bacterium]
MPVSAAALYAWHARPGAFERLNPPFDPVELEDRTGGLEVGARTVLRMKVGPVTQRWVAEHTACEPGRMFRDEQREGPFKKWIHTHRFEAKPDGTSELVDEVEYELPFGGFLGRGFTQATLERLFRYRHALTRADLERHARFPDRRLTVAVTGASGLVGSALLPFLTTGGHEARRVGRQGNALDASALEGADAVVHLAGAGVADERWTDARKQVLIDSRVAYTRQLIAALGKLARCPKVLVSASAIGVYGDRGDEVLTEDSPPGGRAGAAGFLAGLCLDWEAAANEAKALGVRVVNLRIGLVQSARGGALAKLLTPFKAGAGGPVGSGRQWQSWISSEDLLGAIHHALFTEALEGPVNAVGPAPVTSAEYAKALGKVLSRPAIAPLPAFVLRAMFGELADGAILASQRVLPKRLEASGFRFLHGDLDAALRFTLGR